MTKSKFINKIKNLLDIHIPKKKRKKEKVKKVLEKLHSRHKKLRKELKKANSKEKKQDLKESIAIIKKQIKKGENLMRYN